MKPIFKNPVSSNLFKAGFLRSTASMIVTSYSPVFFQKVFTNYKNEYAFINAMSLTIFGFASSLLGGILIDKFENKSYMTGASVIMLGNTLSVPLILIAAFTQNFWLAMACFSLKVLVSGCYLSPAITMIQNTTESRSNGLAVSAYLFINLVA